MAAALAKMLRGGCSGTSSHALVETIGGRRVPHEDFAAPLLPRLGAAASSSPATHVAAGVEAALPKVLRGGRSGLSAHALLPAIGRRVVPHQGVVAPLLLRLGAAAPSSPATPVAAGMARGLMHSGRGWTRGIHSEGPSLVDELKKYHVWTHGSAQMYDSKNILLFLLERVNDLDHHIRLFKRNWVFPALTFGLVLWILELFLYEYFRQLKNKKTLAEIQSSIKENESELACLRSSLAKMEEEVEKLV